MTNTEVKRHIDNARDVLVGKVPDPKGQIDQITNALVYKFMDDIDEQSAAIGGKRHYFTGNYEQYSWKNLMSPKLGAQARIGLYRDALENMSKNPSLPELFRDIFRNAYLPFNDARTLTLFLKEIDYFNYENSELTGHAYEYLLSIMGSQGDAGQFRTPRHIIDFIVEAVHPTKDDSVLDPACGTAGFLISAYRHVMNQHNGDEDIAGVAEQSQTSLTADEKKRIYGNYFGFDIDDNMVKMAKVNMYLHSFLNPRIINHDTLSSEDYWDSKYDVILANPPFMTPKGGIQPHKKFSIQSNRAELLFTEYIINHLKPYGRAGVIVPESIIFQSSKSYKELRRLLFDKGLYAVVSFPPGLFLPYADARTSVLLFDKSVASKTNEFLFLNPRNFGHTLTARVRETEKNDLPKVLNAIDEFKSNGTLSKIEDKNIAFTVNRDKVIEEDDVDLSQENYREYATPKNSDYKFERLGSFVQESKEKARNGSYQVWSVSNISGFVPSEEYFGNKVPSENISSYKLVKPGYFAYNPARINVGSIAYNESDTTGAVSPMYIVFKIDNGIVDPKYLLAFLKSKQAQYHIKRLSQGTVRQQLRFKDLGRIMIIVDGGDLIKDIKDELDSISTMYSKIQKHKKNIDNRIIKAWNE